MAITAPSPHVAAAGESEMIRCPACNRPFQSASGADGGIEINPQRVPANMRIVRLSCICKRRDCRRAFTVRIGVLF